MSPKDCEQVIQRYNHILIDYLNMSKQIDKCASEDKRFYQDICFLFATRLKDMQSKLLDKGFALCKRNKIEANREIKR